MILFFCFFSVVSKNAQNQFIFPHYLKLIPLYLHRKTLNKFKQLKQKIIMKKTLLISAMAFIAIIGLNAQTVWNFSLAPYGAAGATGGSAVIDFTKDYVTADSLLVIGTNGTVNWTGLTTNAKTIDGTAYSYRLQTGGGGSPTAPSKIPVTRYLLFTVSGPSVIKVGMMSSSSTATRTLIVVNADESLVDSVVNISGTAAATYTYNYSGKAGKVYLYSRASGINYYYLSVTNVVKTSKPFLPLGTGLNSALTEKTITFNGSEVINPKGLNIEIYNMLGKRVATSNTNIATKSFQKGIYVVRVNGTNESLKISI